MIWVWDRDTFLNSRNPEIGQWTKHSIDVFDRIARRQSSGEGPAAEADPKSPQRSELRAEVDQFFATWANGGFEVRERFVNLLRRSELRFENVAFAMERQAPNYAAVYAANRLKGNGNPVADFIYGSELEANVRAKIHDYDGLRDIWVQDLTASLDSLAEEFFAKNPHGTLHLGFAIPYDDAIAEWLLTYNRKIDELKQRFGTHRVEGGIDLFVSVLEQDRPEVRAFLGKMQALGTKTTVIANARVGALEAEKYLERHPASFVYGLENFGVKIDQISERFRNRAVRSHVATEVVFPIAQILDREFSQIDEVTASLLKRVSFLFPDAVGYDGYGLEILHGAIELVLRRQAIREHIATMA